MNINIFELGAVLLAGPLNKSVPTPAKAFF